MSISRTTKLKWFARGAAAFERTFPGAIEKQFGPDAPPMYVCPLCDRAFDETSVVVNEAVSDDILTVEHVPPESLDGRPLLLTCKRCNNKAGSKLDAEARRKETLSDILSGKQVKPLAVKVSHGGVTVNAVMRWSGDSYRLDVGKDHNNPVVLQAFQSVGLPTQDTPLNVAFSRDRYSELGAKVSWFRSGFLVLFAAFGYRFSRNPALGIVKRQIIDFEKRLIYSFTIELPERLPSSVRRIITTDDPGCTGVQFGSYVVVFPNAGDLTFYERLEKRIRSRKRGEVNTITFQSYGWPEEPSFGYPVGG